MTEPVEKVDKIKNLSYKERAELADKVRARQIVQTILDYGVNEQQKLQIIKLLALELENRQTMLALLKLVENEDVPSEEQKPKIFT